MRESRVIRPIHDALWISGIITLLVAILIGLGVAILLGEINNGHNQDSFKKELAGIGVVTNLKTTSVHAIVKGQNQIIGYLVINNQYGRAICAAIPGCKAP